MKIHTHVYVCEVWREGTQAHIWERNQVIFICHDLEQKYIACFQKTSICYSSKKPHAIESARKLFCRYNSVLGWPWQAANTNTCSLLSDEQAKGDSTKTKIKKTYGLREKTQFNQWRKDKKQVIQRYQSPPSTSRLMQTHSLSSRYSRKHKTSKQHFLLLYQLYCWWQWQYMIWNTLLANLGQLVWLTISNFLLDLSLLAMELEKEKKVKAFVQCFVIDKRMVSFSPKSNTQHHNAC